MEPVPSSPVRRSRRVTSAIPMRIMPGASRIGFDAHLVDLSLMGVRIQTTVALFAGDLIRIADWGDYGLPIASRVVWVQAIEAGGFLAGLEFLPAPQAPVASPELALSYS